MTKRFMLRLIAMVFILVFVATTGYAKVPTNIEKQNAFLQDMADGIQKRLSEADLDKSTMTWEEVLAYHRKLVVYELDEIEKYSSQVFANDDFNTLAHLYIAACQMQLFATEDSKNEELYQALWNGGSTCRSGIIVEMYEKYNLPITAAEAANYRSNLNTTTTTSVNLNDLFASMLTGQSSSGTTVKDGDLYITASKIELNRLSVGTEYEHFDYSFTVMNNSGYSLKQLYLDCAIQDMQGNLLGMESVGINGTIASGKTAVLKGTIYKSDYEVPCQIVPDQYLYDCTGEGILNAVNANPNNANKYVIRVDNNEKHAATASPTPKPAVDITKVINDILECKNTETEKAWKLINDYHDQMNESQLRTCLLSYARWKGLEEAEKEIKSFLKSPRSYYRYDGNVTQPAYQNDGSYKTEYEIKYGATNSFGGEVTNTVTVYVYFKIDTKGIKVTFTNTELSPYDKFRMVNN